MADFIDYTSLLAHYRNLLGWARFSACPQVRPQVRQRALQTFCVKHEERGERGLSGEVGKLIEVATDTRRHRPCTGRTDSLPGPLVG
jgi:hypothetical protein